jgi:hypothetical protein
MKKIIDELINHSIKGVDVYRWKDATWLIFTDETRWVVELTDEGTLWYNYKFFKDIFKYVSITVGTEMDGYIIQWANEYFFKVSTLRSIANNPEKDRSYTEKVLENGIKETKERGKNHGDEFEWHTRAVVNKGIKEVNDSSSIHRQMRAENLVGRIIRDVKPNIEYSEQTGVYDPDCNGNKTEIWRIVDECIKNIYPDHNSGEYDWSGEFETGKIIEGGVKEVKRSLMYSNSDIELIVEKIKPNNEFSYRESE